MSLHASNNKWFHVSCFMTHLMHQTSFICNYISNENRQSAESLRASRSVFLFHVWWLIWSIKQVWWMSWVAFPVFPVGRTSNKQEIISCFMFDDSFHASNKRLISCFMFHDSFHASNKRLISCFHVLIHQTSLMHECMRRVSWLISSIKLVWCIKLVSCTRWLGLALARGRGGRPRR